MPHPDDPPPEDSVLNPPPDGSLLNPPSRVELSRVSFKAPPFWKANPELWFIQLESNFNVAGITSDNTKFHSVVAAIDTDILTYVSDLVRCPPETDKYKSLKERIVGQFSQSETSRLRSLLQEIQLGDKKPSQLLREMKDLAQNKLSDDMLGQLWKQRLPLNCQQILSVSTQPLDSLASLADKITEVSGLTPHVSEVAQNPSLSSCSFTMLQKQISELQKSVERLSRDRVRSSSPRNRDSRSKSRDRRHRSPAVVSKYPMCWYHFKYGNNARNCVQPCNFSEN